MEVVKSGIASKTCTVR